MGGIRGVERAGRASREISLVQCTGAAAGGWVEAWLSRVWDAGLGLGAGGRGDRGTGAEQGGECCVTLAPGPACTSRWGALASHEHRTVRQWGSRRSPSCLVPTAPDIRLPVALLACLQGYRARSLPMKCIACMCSTVCSKGWLNSALPSLPLSISQPCVAGKA